MVGTAIAVTHNDCSMEWSYFRNDDGEKASLLKAD